MKQISIKNIFIPLLNFIYFLALPFFFFVFYEYFFDWFLSGDEHKKVFPFRFSSVFEIIFFALVTFFIFLLNKKQYEKKEEGFILSLVVPIVLGVFFVLAMFER